MNRVMLLGNIGADPELRMTQGGNAVLKFSLATSFRWKDERGEKQEKTEWHRCVMWGKRAEGLAKHLSKGSKIAVEGRIQYGKYEDKNGVERYSTDIVIDTLHFAGAKREAGGEQDGPSPYAGNYGAEKKTEDKSFDDDDIPF
jgi:single-strand DNA-binding protein